LITRYTDLNMGGVASGNLLRWGFRLFMPEMYYHNLVPPWGFEVAYDNFAVSNNGTKIGRAANDCSTTNSCGTGDPSSPYRNINGEAAFLGRRVGGDCVASGYIESSNDVKYRNGGSLQSAITHRLYTTCCFQPISYMLGTYTNPPVNTLFTVTDGLTSSDCATGGGTVQHNCLWNGTTWVATTATDMALKVNLTNASDGGGSMWFVNNAGNNGTVFPQFVNHGFIYLPSSNNYTVTNLALTGFIRDFNNGNGAGY